MNTKSVAIGSIVSILVVSSSVAQAGLRTCEMVMTGTLYKTAAKIPLPLELDAALKSNYDSNNVRAYGVLKALNAAFPEFKSQVSFQNSLVSILEDEQSPMQHEIALKILKKIEAAKVAGTLVETATSEEIVALFSTELETHLVTILPEADAKARAALVKEANLNEPKMRKALAQLTQKETVAALVGPGGIAKVSKDSLVGRYLNKAKSHRKKPATFVGTFKKGKETNARGSKRLFVAVDEQTVMQANDVFGVNPLILAHNHDDGQGTLQLHHNGKTITYARYTGEGHLGYEESEEEFERPVFGRRSRRVVDYFNTRTIIPLIALSGVEASRSINYFDLGMISNKARAKYPWSLVFKKGRKEDPYCRPGGYTSCTHWFGEMPLGETEVSDYSFPGNFDEHADQEDPKAEDQTAIRTGPVGRYTHFLKYGEKEKVGEKTRTDRLTRFVWQQGSGAMQMWQMLNGRAELEKGEYANPGWVLYSLLAPAPAARVPVVLVYVNDASEPLTQERIDELTEYISEY